MPPTRKLSRNYVWLRIRALALVVLMIAVVEAGAFGLSLGGAYFALLIVPLMLTFVGALVALLSTLVSTLTFPFRFSDLGAYERSPPPDGFSAHMTFEEIVGVTDGQGERRVSRWTVGAEGVEVLLP